MAMLFLCHANASAFSASEAGQMPKASRWKVYPSFIPNGDRIVSKTYITRVEGENTRLRHYLARLHRKTLCYSKSEKMLKHSIRLLIHYLKFEDVPIPHRLNLRFNNIL